MIVEHPDNSDVDFVDKASLLHNIVRVCDFKESDYSKFEQAVTAQLFYQRSANVSSLLFSRNSVG